MNIFRKIGRFIQIKVIIQCLDIRSLLDPSSVGLDDLVEFFNIEVKHLVCDALDVVLLELIFDSQKTDVLL